MGKRGIRVLLVTLITCIDGMLKAFQCVWQSGTASVTPRSSVCSASFSFTSFITSPGNTQRPLLLAVLAALCLPDVQVPSPPPINTRLISQQKPAANLQIPFYTPVKQSPSAVWLCPTRAVLHWSCALRALGEHKWQQMSQDVPDALTKFNLAYTYMVTTRRSCWHRLSRLLFTCL